MIPRREFLFLRHGQTEWNREGRYQGAVEIPLNETGLAQARAAATTLASHNVDRIIASPLDRALKTAAIVAEAVGAPIHIDRGLRERDFGSFNGLVIREVKAKHGIPPDQSTRSILPSDADPWDEIFIRIPPVIAAWMTRHPAERLLFVAHSGAYDALHLHFNGEPRKGSESGHAAPYRAMPGPSGWDFRPIAG